MSPSELYLYELQERRAKRKWRLRWLFLFLGLYGLTLGGLWLLLVSPVPRFKNIVITGNSKMGRDQILEILRATVFENLWRRNLLGFNNILAWPGNLRLENMVLLPTVKSINVKRDLINKTVRVTVEDRNPYGIWCVQTAPQNCYWFDDEGVIFKKTAIVEGSLIRAVNDYSGRVIGLNFRVLPEQFLKNIFQILETTENLGLSVKEVRIDSLEKEELTAITYAGVAFYFGLRYPAGNLASAIDALRQKVDFDKLEYVDFRVENRVYYK